MVKKRSETAIGKKATLSKEADVLADQLADRKYGGPKAERGHGTARGTHSGQPGAESRKCGTAAINHSTTTKTNRRAGAREPRAEEAPAGDDPEFRRRPRQG